jgi:2-polyprenyl-3-methyl-5-hydroxy-6-metoxy-1,4-benzoquinol methylase
MDTMDTLIPDRSARWRRALLLPGETDLVQSSLRELAEYFALSSEAARQACERALADSRREWEASPRRTPEQVLDFYRSTRSYIFEHIWWHATDVETNSGNIAILDCALGQRRRDYLDFGSGVGANAILFAQHGMSVTLADVSQTMLAFARWRLARRGLQAAFIDLNQQGLPKSRFDVVTAVDVFEHLARPGVEIARLAASLRTGGLMVFNDGTGPDPERPMHIVSNLYPILRAFRRNGLREADPVAAEVVRQIGFRVVTKREQSFLSCLVWALFDAGRYGRPGLLASGVLRRLRTLRPHATHSERP